MHAPAPAPCIAVSLYRFLVVADFNQILHANVTFKELDVSDFNRPTKIPYTFMPRAQVTILSVDKNR